MALNRSIATHSLALDKDHSVDVLYCLKWTNGYGPTQQRIVICLIPYRHYFDSVIVDHILSRGLLPD